MKSLTLTLLLSDITLSSFSLIMVRIAQSRIVVASSFRGLKIRLILSSPAAYATTIRYPLATLRNDKIELIFLLGTPMDEVCAAHCTLISEKNFIQHLAHKLRLRCSLNRLALICGKHCRNNVRYHRPYRCKIIDIPATYALAFL